MKKSKIETKSYKSRLRILIVFGLAFICLGAALIWSVPANAGDNGKYKSKTYSTKENLAKVYQYASDVSEDSEEELSAMVFLENDSIRDMSTILGTGTLLASYYETEILNLHKQYVDSGQMDEKTFRDKYLTGKYTDKIEELRTGGSIADHLLYNDNAFAKYGLDITKLVGMVLIFVYTLITLIESLQQDEGSLEGYIKVALTFLIGILVLSYIDDILRLIEELGTWFYKQMNLKFSNGLVKANMDLSGLGAVSDAAEKWFFKALLLITYYAIFAGAYGLLFEMVIRRVFLPIAAASVATEGLRSPGFRYIKNYFGCYLRMAMFSIIIIIGDYIINYAYYSGVKLNSTLGALGTVLCVRIAIKATMSSTANIAKEALG